MEMASDEALIESLKEWMAMSGVRLTDLAEDIGVPYRTLQNQFRGVSKMPATTLLRILERFNLNSAHLRPRVHIIDPVALSMALTKVFGSALPSARIKDGGVELEMTSSANRSADELRHSAMVLSVALSDTYTEEELRNFLTVERNRTRQKKGSQ